MKKNEIMELVEKRNYKLLKDRLSRMNPVDVADVLSPLDSQVRLLIYRMLPKELSIEVFVEFSNEIQTEIITTGTKSEVKEIIDELFFDDMIDLIEEVPATVVNKILEHTEDEERKLINQFLNYPEESAGCLMTIEYISLGEDMTVEESLRRIKEVGLSKEVIYTCYVLNEDRSLVGYVSLRKIVTSSKNTLIKEIMEEDIISVHTHDDQEIVANVFHRYGFVALPVVDNNNRLTGIITVDDIMKIMELEATEDFQIMAGTSPTKVSYLETSAWKLAKNRLPWLLILMISATFTGRIMGHYEDILMSVVVLSTFIPMLMDTGGNAGSQSSTLVIRGLATGQIENSKGLQVIWKEARVSLITGLSLAIVNYFRLILLEKVSPTIAFTVSFTLFMTVLMSSIVGGFLPIVADKLKLDPAIMAGPLITTIVDAMSLYIYFLIATRLLGI